MNRVGEFIEFSREWHVRLVQGRDPDASEFEKFTDLLSSGRWHVTASNGTDQPIVQAPVFVGSEITWRVR